MGEPIGCAFRERCPIAEEKCAEAPPIVRVTETRSVRCWVAQRESLARSAATGASMPRPSSGAVPAVPAGERVELSEARSAAASPVADSQSVLLAVRDVKKHFDVRRGLGRKTRTKVFAVDGVTFELNRGETFGLVGESGCGKSTLARVLAGLYAPTAGTILLRGEDVHAAGARKRLRGELQMVFQNPASSLDPRRRIADSVAEPLIGSSGSKSRNAAALEMLERVGLEPKLQDRFPHQLSGGQQQRACIARALVADPALVVLDEALSSLDVSLQAQMMTLLNDLQAQFGCAYVFITHDLATAFQLSTRIAIMYLGEIVELLPADAFHEGTLHPYSRALVEAVLIPDPAIQRHRKHIRLERRRSERREPTLRVPVSYEMPVRPGALQERAPGSRGARAGPLGCLSLRRPPATPRRRRSGGRPRGSILTWSSYVLAKTAGLVAVLLAVSVVVFFLGRGVAPGDVGTVIIGTDGATPEQIEKVRHELGLDRPLYIAYFKWLGDAVRLRLGSSPISGLSVTSQLAQQLPVSLELAFLAVVLTTLIGVPLGVIAAVHANGVWDTAIRVSSSASSRSRSS